MGYKQPSSGLPFKEMGSSTPAKQLAPEYMQSEQMEALFKGDYDADPSKWEPTKPGEIRGLGTYVRNKETGEVKGTGMGHSKKKEGTSVKIGPEESPEMIAKSKEEWKDARKKAEDSDKIDWDLEDKSEKEYDEYAGAKDYVKKKSTNKYKESPAKQVPLDPNYEREIMKGQLKKPSVRKAIDEVNKQLSKAKNSKILDAVTNEKSNIKKQLDNIRKKSKHLKPKNVVVDIVGKGSKGAKRQVQKGIIKKVAGKIGSRLIPYAGWALAASDAIGIGKKMYKGASLKDAAKEQFLGIKKEK